VEVKESLIMATMDIVSVYDEFLEYLAQKADPQEVLAFKASSTAQRRADELTERNKDGTLTEQEKLELDQMLHFNRLVSRLKAKALSINTL
jgi:uncharacterized protein YciU (UPF0263 family)